MFASIVIPVYNVADYLQGCVNSVLANDCTDCEIILVDDGATDGICPALCDRIAGEHPDLIRVIHQENRGLGGARNTGIEAAKGEYLLFIDSDDTVVPDAVAALRQAVQRTHAQVISFDFETDDGEGHHSPVKKSYFSAAEPFRLRDRREFLLSAPAAWSYLWKRSLFLDTGIRYPDRVWYEDVRTTTKLLARAESIVTLDRPLYRYLARPGSITRNAKLDRNREIMEAFEDILGWFRRENLFGDYEKELCRLTAEHVLLVASVRVARSDPKHPLLSEFAAFVEREFPDYARNPYLAQLPRAKRLALWLVQHHQFRLVQLLFAIKGH